MLTKEDDLFGEEGYSKEVWAVNLASSERQQSNLSLFQVK
jgi:hypothetical protein